MLLFCLRCNVNEHKQFKLDDVHEAALHFVECQHAEEHDGDGEHERVEQVGPFKRALAKEGQFEGLDDGREGIGDDGPHIAGIVALQYGQRIDDGRDVHPQLHAEGHEEAQVAVFGGHRRDDEAEAEAEACQHHHEEGHQQDVPCDVWRKAFADEEDVDGNEQDELDGHLQQAGDGDGEGHHQAGEVDLAEDVLVGVECLRAFGEALREVVPAHDACHVEQRLRQSVGGYAGDAAEDEHEHDGGHQRLDEIPDGAEDGLFVHGDDVAFDVHHQQVAVSPDFS